MSKTLSDYIIDAQRLLHDSTYRFWDQTELTDYANKARKMTAALTACTRTVAAAVSLPQVGYWIASTSQALGSRVITSPANGFYYRCSAAGTTGTTAPAWPVVAGNTVTDGTAVWTCVSGFANSYDLSTLISGKDVLGCLDIYLYNLGLTRYPLYYFPFSDYNRRPEVMYQSPGTPTIWSQMNNTLFIAAPASVNYIADFDCLVVPSNLSALADIDADIPFPQTEIVCYYMAFLAKKHFQRSDQAQEYLQDFYREGSFWISAEIQRRLIGR